MTGFLLDTNVLSELKKPIPEPKVVKWVEDADDGKLFLSVMTLGEIVKGITAHKDIKRRIKLQKWLDDELRPWFKGRILPVNELVAERWGVLDGECKLKGTPLNVVDGLIAASALEHNLTIVTRNESDFSHVTVPLLNPWT